MSNKGGGGATLFIGVLILFGYFSMQAALMFGVVNLTGTLATLIVGSVKAMEGLAYLVAGYYLGSSNSSQMKDHKKFMVEDDLRKARLTKEAKEHWDKQFGTTGKDTES